MATQAGVQDSRTARQVHNAPEPVFGGGGLEVTDWVMECKALSPQLNARWGSQQGSLPEEAELLSPLSSRWLPMVGSGPPQAPLPYCCRRRAG